MMKTKITCLIIALIAISSCNKTGTISEKLWYKSPADDWFSALPLGNGRLGERRTPGPNVSYSACFRRG